MTKYYFKKFTPDESKYLKQFDPYLNPEQYTELETKAREAFNSQSIKAKHGRKNFDEEHAFISSSDSMNGFYFPSAEFINEETGYRLLLIAFKKICGYDFKKRERLPERVEAVAIYQDGNEELYIRKSAVLDRIPLEKWQKELKDKINRTKEKIELWKKVKQVYKKDGTQFALLHKNFENVSVTSQGDVLQCAVVGRMSSGEYVSDTLYDCDVRPLKNIGDVMPAIAQYITYLNDYAFEIEKILELSEDIYLDVCGAVFDKVLKYQTPSNKHGIMIDYFMYTVRDWLKSFYVSI